MRKRNIVITCILVTVLVIGTISVVAMRNRKSADVQSVSMLNAGYFGDDTSIYGNVVKGSTQQVYVEENIIISQTYVTDGQTVQVGDPLLAYDLTTLEIAVESAKLQLQQTNVDIQNTQNNIVRLQNTQPIPDPTPIPTIEPTPVPTPEVIVIPTPIKQEGTDAYDCVVSYEQRYIDENDDIDENLIKISDRDNNDSNANNDTDSQTDGDDEENDDSNPSDDTDSQTGDEEEEDNNSNPDNKPEEKPYYGSSENPIRFIVQENGVVYGKFFNDMLENYPKADYGNIFIQFEIHENDLANEEMISSWLVRLDRFNHGEKCVDEDSYSILTHQKIEDDEVIDDVIIDDSDIDIVEPDGYTASELAQMIEQEKSNLIDLQIQQRRNNLTLQEQQQALSDGVIYAKKAGVVTLSGTRSSSEPYLTVKGSSGLEIDGTISERLLNQLDESAELYATDWQTGTSFIVRISSIDTFPVSGNEYMYDSSDNASYYTFHAYTDEDISMQEGSYVSMSLSSNQYDYNAIILENAYINHDAGGSFVMKAVDGELVKTYVTIGKVYYGVYSEIKSGITQEDYIAFPYGPSAEEGTKVNYPEEFTDDSYYEDIELYDSVWEG